MGWVGSLRWPWAAIFGNDWPPLLPCGSILCHPLSPPPFTFFLVRGVTLLDDVERHKLMHFLRRAKYLARNTPRRKMRNAKSSNVDEGTKRLNPSRNNGRGTHCRRKAEKTFLPACVAFLLSLLCDSRLVRPELCRKVEGPKSRM